MRSMLLGFMAITLTVAAAAQTTPVSANPVDLRTEAAIQAQAKELTTKAKANPDGTAIAVLDRYPGHFTELIVRTKDGGAEVHANFNDLFIVLEGEANVLTGGTVVDGKETEPGETRGSRIEGGTPHTLHKGDVLHISPGVPHQTTVPVGKTFTYLVVKVGGPK